PAILPGASALLAQWKRCLWGQTHRNALPVLSPFFLLQWEETMETLTSAELHCHRTMNPCPVYDQENKTVFLFFNCVKKCVTENCQKCSGSLTDLTEEVIGDDVRNWATFAVGPGHGVQLKSGRLVLPAYAYHIIVPCSCCFLLWCCSPVPHSLIFYSTDDKREKWQKSELMQGMATLECQVAEVTSQEGDTVLYCNTRTTSPFRAEAFSKKEELNFEIPYWCKELRETRTGCQGSVVSFLSTSRSPGVNVNDTPSNLLFSHPTGNERKDLGIYRNLSPLEEGKWEGPCLLYNGPSGYSDLAVCQGPPLLFGCLFECGKVHPYEEIAFQLFNEQKLQSTPAEQIREQRGAS
uniref:exo-alpha-sialidase n=1 Tax=Pelusios castaneus TaxID=367368 RepID=A0A8C8S784_9SAUR